MYKVMIVDDEPNIRNGLRYIIDWEEYNFTVTSIAKNGRGAIEKMESNYPDLIITDIKMPVLKGLGLIQYVRETLNDQNMSFIVLSGYDDFNYAKKAIKYNVNNYMLKPIDEDELIDTLKKIDNKLSKDNIYNFFYNKRVDKLNDNFDQVKEIDLLIDAIINNKESKIEKIINDIFKYFDKICLHPRLIKIHIDNYIIKLSNAISDMGGSIDDIIKNYRFFQTSIANLNVIQLQYSLIGFSIECSGYISELKQSCGVINKVKRYIKENYTENLKLKNIAKRFYINPAYLGQLFKKETGLNFSQYLNEIRIKNAKKLLERTDLHIYQIAEKVGYKNSDYFIIKFKEYEDYTPMEYKNIQRA
ncbi:MAG: response regulator transcription factor [Halothermotrichaceae bacterium]